VLTEAQIAALEERQREWEAPGEVESECPGYCGVGRIYQQTFIDTYAKVGFAKLYTDKTPVTAADRLNDRVLPFFAEPGIAVSRLLTDRGTEYCGTPDRHPFELYLALENIEHTRTKTKHPQTHGLCERFNKTLLDEFYRVAFRRTFYEALEPLQADLDAFVDDYNHRRPHRGRWCYGKTPMQTFLDSLALAKEKLIA
jgi:transposase InsO family protein